MENRSDVELYELKNKYLSTFYPEELPKDFYREVFPLGSFERQGYPGDQKANGVMTVIEANRAKNYIVFDELDIIDEMVGKEFVVISPVSYSGRNRTAQNARWLYGITIDLDGVEMQNLKDVFYQMENGILPYCTYCVNSGHGLHLYYLLEKPIPLYKHMHDKLREFKYELISKVWNRYTSTYKERDQVQYQGIFQGFRMVGSQSKLGECYPVRAYKVGKKVSIEYLNDFLIDDTKAITDFSYQSELSITEAKELYPEWYESRIVNKQIKKRWHVKRALYDWWLKKIKEGASVGHRYSCLSVLATYAIKCDIDYDELLNDALELLPFLDNMSDDEHNRFTRQDVLDAVKLYQEAYVTYSRKEAERVSGISIPANKRNGRKQDVHLKRARAVQDIDYPNGEWRNINGRPSKEHIVEDYLKANPEASKADIIRDTGLSKPTVYKWYDKIKNKLSSDV